MRYPYDLVLFAHILSGMVLVASGMLAAPPLQSWIRAASTLGELRRWLSVTKSLSRIAATAAVALLLSGIYLTWVRDGWSMPWILVAIGFWVLNSVLAGTVIDSRTSRIAALVTGSSAEAIPPPIDEARNSRTFAVTADVMLGSDLGVLFLMVARPSSYASSMIVMAISLLGVVGYRRLRVTRRRPAIRTDVLLAGEATLDPREA